MRKARDRKQLLPVTNIGSDERWAEYVKTYPFRPGDRVKFTAKSVKQLNAFAVKLDRPDVHGIYNEETRATVIRPLRDMWGHTMLLNVDGVGEMTFAMDHWEHA